MVTYHEHLQARAEAVAIQQGKYRMPTRIATALAAAERTGYLVQGDSWESRVIDALWFDRCKAENRTYAYARGTRFCVDLIGQSYTCHWSLADIDALFAQIEPLCSRNFALNCCGVNVEVRGVPPANREAVARLVLEAVEGHRVPNHEGHGYMAWFTRSQSPAKALARRQGRVSVGV